MGYSGEIQFRPTIRFNEHYVDERFFQLMKKDGDTIGQIFCRKPGYQSQTHHRNMSSGDAFKGGYASIYLTGWKSKAESAWK